MPNPFRYLLNAPLSLDYECSNDFNTMSFHPILIKDIYFGIYKVNIKEQSWSIHSSWYQNITKLH